MGTGEVGHTTCLPEIVARAKRPGDMAKQRKRENVESAGAENYFTGATLHHLYRSLQKKTILPNPILYVRLARSASFPLTLCGSLA